MRKVAHPPTINTQPITTLLLTPHTTSIKALRVSIEMHHGPNNDTLKPIKNAYFKHFFAYLTVLRVNK